MREFELESFAEKIYFGKTKKYFEEVVKTYQGGCYRSSIVMLWSVAVSDLLFKLKSLADQYEDKKAINILDQIKRIQDKDPRSAAWELEILDQIYSTTNLIDNSEYENLRYLQKQRHLSAHPILKENLELYAPNKDTARSLIRNTVESLLIKPPFYTQKIISSFLEDIDESKSGLTSFAKVKKYVESAYFNRMIPEHEISLFRLLWKLTFKVVDEKCDDNRFVNLRVLRVICMRHTNLVEQALKNDPDYYNSIAAKGKPLELLSVFLSYFPDFYGTLNEATHAKLEDVVLNTRVGRIGGWYTHRDLIKHFKNLVEWVEDEDNSRLALTEAELTYLSSISDSEEWERCFCKIVSSYYCASLSFDTADNRFSTSIHPYLEFFDEQSAVYLLEKIEGNSQVWARSRAASDHGFLRERFESIFDEDFDFAKFKHFEKNTSDEK